MKKLAILGPGVVGGSCAEILLRDAALLERNAGEKLELSYVLARRELPDRRRVLFPTAGPPAILRVSRTETRAVYT